MKLAIKNFIRKYLQKIGIYVEFEPRTKIQFFPTPKFFYNYIKDVPKSLKESELRNITYSLKITKNHKTYERLLKTFVPNWKADITNATFMGKGIGEGSLNTYRKVRIENELYFEKIYFNDHQIFKHVQFFEDHIYKLIKDKIKVPRIQKTYGGEVLTIVYYDYMVLNELDEETREKRLIQFSKYFYRISCKNESYLKKMKLPDSIKDFRRRYQYRNNIITAKAKLLQHISTKTFEKLLDRTKHILTHGDLHEDNSFKQAVLVDWDRCGIYPLGFEPAYIYYCLMLKNNKKGHVINWLEEHYFDTISEKDWQDFKRNFAYLLFVFSIKLFEKEQFKNTERQLIRTLNEFNSNLNKESYFLR
jgi:hypothetical protein